MNIETKEAYQGIKLIIKDESTTIDKVVSIKQVGNMCFVPQYLLEDIAQVYHDLSYYNGESVTECFGRLLGKETLSQSGKEELIELIKGL